MTLSVLLDTITHSTILLAILLLIGLLFFLWLDYYMLKRYSDRALKKFDDILDTLVKRSNR